MGKTRNKKKRGNKFSPTGLPSVKDVISEEGSLGDGYDVQQSSSTLSRLESHMQSIMDQLQSASAEEREYGCNNLAFLLDENDAAEVVLQHGLVKVVGPLLVDKSYGVRHAAAGALRNLSASGGHTACDFMVEYDIMTPLTVLLKEYFCDWLPSKKAIEEQKIDTNKEVFLQAVHLLWNLCESSSTALSLFNKADVLPNITRCLDVEVFDRETVVAVAQCLNTVSENSPEVIAKLSQSEDVLRRLLELPGEDSSSLLLRTLTAGIILNLSHGEIKSLPSDIISGIMNTISSALEVNQNDMVSKYLDRIPDNSKKESAKDVEDVNHAFEELDYMLIAQQLSLEILTNICCCDDGDEWEEQDSLSTSSDEELQYVIDDSEMMESDKYPLCLSPEVHEAILSHQMVKKTLDKATYTEESAHAVLRDNNNGRKVFRKIATLRCRAFLCLHNLVSNLDIDDLGGPQQMYSVWCNLGVLTFKETASGDTELLEAATSLMRAILQKLVESKYKQFEQLTEQDLQLMFNGASQCSDANVRVNLIRITGTLGVLLGNTITENGKHLLKLIGKFHLDVCNKEPELWVVAETLDAIFDIFGEDHTDGIAEEIGLIEKLKSLLPAVKHKVTLQKKTLGDHYPIVMTAKTNLVRFIKYRSSHHGVISAENGK